MSVQPAVGPIPEGRSIRKYTSAATNQRSGAGLGDLLSGVYYAVVSAGISIGLALGAAGTLRDVLPVDSPAGRTEAGLSLPTLVAVIVVGLVGVLLSLSARLGPVGAGGAEATWWLPLPVDRRALIRPASLRLPVLAALVGALLVGLLDAGLLGDHDAGSVVRAILVAAFVAAAVVLSAGLAQTVDLSQRAIALGGDLLLAAAPVVAVVGAVLGWRLDALPTPPWWFVAALVLAVVGVGASLDRRLGLIHGRSLRAGGSVASQAVGAMVSLDSRELGRALSDSSARTRRRRSLRFAWVAGPERALVTADALAFVRSPRHVVQVVVAALLPVLVAAVPQLAGAVGFMIAVLAGGAAAMIATGEGARRAEMVPALDRLLPLGARRVRLVRMVVPWVVMLVWSLVAFGAVGAWYGDLAGWLALGVVSSPVWAAAAVRSAYRPAPDWTAPLVSTPMGALPSGVAMVLARGPDAVVIGMIPVGIAFALGGVHEPILVTQVILSMIAVSVCSSVVTLMERMQSAEAEKKKLEEDKRSTRGPR